MYKAYLTTAAFIGALSVALGAFGAHALKNILPDQALATYDTAIRYQFYHVFALALTGILYKTFPNKLVKLAGQLFILGIVFFCGSLYLLTYASTTTTSFRWAGPITPLGGVMFIIAWICLALGIRKSGS